MTSALERLRQIRTQKEDQRKKSDTEMAEWQNKREAEERRQREDRLRHVTEVGQRVFNETKIIEQLKDIERHECSSFPRHAVVVNYTEMKATATLAWGKAFSVKNNEIEDEVPLFILRALGKQDYFYIQAVINPDTEGIYISKQGTEIPTNSWKSNPEVISDALAKSFLDPHHEYIKHSEGYYDSRFD